MLEFFVIQNHLRVHYFNEKKSKIGHERGTLIFFKVSFGGRGSIILPLVMIALTGSILQTT